MKTNLAYDAPEGAPSEVPDHRWLGEYAARAPAPRAPLDTVVSDAFHAPTGAEPLRDLAHGKRRVLILVDDMTRLTPVRALLPHVARELEAANVDDEHVTILTAPGTHRKLNDDELNEKIGPTFRTRWRIAQHDHRDEDQLVDCGETTSGTQIRVNRLLHESDLCVGIGQVGPHGIMGYSGGAKIVLPGIAGAHTERCTHWRAGDEHEPGMLLGMMDGPLRRDIEEGARLAGLEVVLNITMDREGHVQHAAYGDFVKAQRACADAAQRLAALDVPPAEVVIAEAKPADRDYWQSIKALYAATLVAREGGRMILVSPNSEGVAKNHPNMLTLAGRPPHEIRQRVAKGEEDDLIGAGIALMSARMRERANVTLVSSGITPAEARRLGFRHEKTPQAAIDHALQEAGNDDARVVLLRHGGGIVPVVRGRNAHLLEATAG